MRGYCLLQSVVNLLVAEVVVVETLAENREIG